MPIPRATRGIHIRIIQRIRLHRAIIQPRQARHLTPDRNRIIRIDRVVAVHVAADAQPHDGRVLDLVDHPVQIIPEHARPERLTAGFQESDKAGYDGIKRTEYRYQHSTRITRPQRRQRRSKHYLAQQHAVRERSGEGVGGVLGAAVFEGAHVEGVWVRLVG